MTRINCIPVTFGGPTEQHSSYWNFKEAIRNAFRGQTITSNKDLKVNIDLFIEEKRVRRNRNRLGQFPEANHRRTRGCQIH